MFEPSLFTITIVSSLLFFIGTIGIFFINRSIIVALISLELMLIAISVNFVAFSVFYKDISGQIFTIFILGIAAAETAIGLALMLAYYRCKKDINIETINYI